MFLCTHVYIRTWIKVRKTDFELCQQNMIWKFTCAFTLTLIDYRKPPKLYYCFITRTSLVFIAVPTQT